MSSITHPSWCEATPSGPWHVHGRDIGSVNGSDVLAFDVAVRQWSQVTPPVVSLTTVDGYDDTLCDLTPAEARRLAALLVEAADLADGRTVPSLP